MACYSVNFSISSLSLLPLFIPTYVYICRAVAIFNIIGNADGARESLRVVGAEKAAPGTLANTTPEALQARVPGAQAMGDATARPSCSTYA